MLRYSFGNIDGKAYGLNANELSVYEAIGKCSRKDDARGWYASMQALADALPFVISYKTVERAVTKLFNLGLVEKRDNALFINGQNVPNNGQNVQINGQIVPNNGQNVQINGQIVQESAPPYNPPINNNNEMEKENTRTCVPAHDTAKPQTPSLKLLIEAYKEKGGNDNGYYIDLARDAWEKCTLAKKTKLLAAVRSGAHFKAHIHWLITDFPEPTPTNWQGTTQGGDMLNDGTAKIALYNGRYGIYSLDDIRLFNLELSDYQRGRR